MNFIVSVLNSTTKDSTSDKEKKTETTRLSEKLMCSLCSAHKHIATLLNCRQIYLYKILFLLLQKIYTRTNPPWKLLRLPEVLALRISPKYLLKVRERL